MTKKDDLEFGKLAKKLNDLPGKSIINESITKEFASRSAVQHDTDGQKLIATVFSSVGRVKAF